jgi:hypothetical protein
MNLEIKSEGPLGGEMVEPKWYPTTCIESKKDLELPESGTITFKFKRTMKEERERNGVETYRYELDLTDLVSVKDAEKKGAPSREDVIAMLAKEVAGGEDDD